MVENDFTFAMVNYKTSYMTADAALSGQVLHDLTVYIVYDHRVNN